MDNSTGFSELKENVAIKDNSWKSNYNGITNGKKIYILLVKEIIKTNVIDLHKLQILNEVKNEFKLSKWYINRKNKKYLLPFIKNIARDLIFNNKFNDRQKELFLQISSIVQIEQKIIDKIIKNQAVEYFYFKKNQATEDQRITPEEEKELYSIAKKLNLSEEDIKMSSSEQSQLALYKFYYEIEQGHLPDIDSSVLLSRGEICHYESSAYRVETKTKVVGYRGGSTGVSLRIAKGLTVRTGAFRGHPITQEIETIHEGLLSITNKRLIFVSRSKGFSAPIQNIVGLEGFSDGLGIKHGQKYYLMRCQYPELIAMIITASIENK